MGIRRFGTLLCLALAAFAAAAQGQSERVVGFECGGKIREAKIYAPEGRQRKKLPLVFVFHGRGGMINSVARNMAIHKYWPEAVVVYPQGLWVEGGLRDGYGWLISPDSRDLEMFDTLLDMLKREYRIDNSRIYATGHSNGGGFVYALWTWRGDKLAAVAPSASSSARVGEGRYNRRPMPVLIVGGEADHLVKIETVRREIAMARKINGDCEVATFIHAGGHKFVPEAAEKIVQFFKCH